MSHYHADAWGGTALDDFYGGVLPQQAIVPSNGELVQGQWDEDVEVPDAKFCISTSAKTDKQCRAYPKKGELHCIYHLHRVKASVDGADT